MGRLVVVAGCVRRVGAALNLYCSSPNTAWCQGMAVGFEKATGVKVAVVQKATGEMLAQIKAEKANPKGDIWWAGPADAYLQAAEEGLLETYRSPNLVQLHDWARRIRTSRTTACRASTAASSRSATTPSSREKRKLPVPRCWKDLLDPSYKGEVMLGNPELVGHCLPDARLARAGIRRGRGVRLHEGAQRQRRLSTRARASAR